MASTSLFSLANAVLGEDLNRWVLDKRAAGLSWLQVSKELYVATDHLVDVTPQTIANWVTKNGDEAA